MLKMSSQVVIITGAASGLGAAIALSFAKLNAGLCITDINKDDLHKTGIHCQKLSNTKVVEIAGDMRKDDDRENIVKSALKEFGKLDVLVNCAGIFDYTQLQDSGIMEKFDKLFEVNVRSVVSLTNKALPALIESKGCIINISSVCSSMIFENTLVYSMTKAAVTTFTKCVAFELATMGVRVNSIAPGVVKTNIFCNGIPGLTEKENNANWDELLKKVALKKFVKAEDIAEMAVYLASDKAASITGSQFVVDGGMMLGDTPTSGTQQNIP